MSTELYDHIKFIVHPPIEFLFAIINTTYYEKNLGDNVKSLPAELKQEFNNSVIQIRKNQSKFMKSELEFFFDCSSDTIMGLGYMIILNTVLNNANMSSVEDMLEILANEDSVQMFSYTVKMILEINYSNQINNICSWEKIKNKTEEMLKLISNTPIQNTEFKEKLIECLENTNEAKERFCFILKQFWKVYSPFEKDILIKTTNFYLSRYKNLFNDNPERFLKLFVNTKITQSQEITIVISYFRCLGCDTWGNSDNKNLYMWCILGVFAEKFITSTTVTEDIQKFFKVLSDKNRLDIIRLLNKNDLYVYELAEKLKMTAATISYHLSLLVELRIVQFERYDHRIYYSLDKERLRKLAKDSIEGLLSE